jgi:hypothetical protein
MDAIRKKYFDNKASEILSAMGLFRGDANYYSAKRMISDNLELAFLEGKSESATDTIDQIRKHLGDK